MTENELQDHNSEIHNGITFSCTECHFVTSSKLNHEMHENSHNKKAYNCQKELCNMVFFSQRRLEKHEKKLHSAVLLNCPECSFESYNKMDLIIHKNEHNFYKWLHANGLFPESVAEMS